MLIMNKLHLYKNCVKYGCHAVLLTNNYCCYCKLPSSFLDNHKITHFHPFRNQTIFYMLKIKKDFTVITKYWIKQTSTPTISTAHRSTLTKNAHQQLYKLWATDYSTGSRLLWQIQQKEGKSKADLKVGFNRFKKCKITLIILFFSGKYFSQFDIFSSFSTIL